MKKTILLSLYISLSYGCSEDKAKLQHSGNKASQSEECLNLSKEALLQSKKITNTTEWNKYVDELQRQKPKDCILSNDGKRF